MSAAVLRFSNCPPHKIRHRTLARAPQPNHSNHASKDSKTFVPNSRRRNRTSAACRSDAQSTVVVRSPGKNLVMGKVKILKRGETLGSLPKQSGGGDADRWGGDGVEDPDLVLGSTDRLGPEPETVQKQIMVRGGLKSAIGIRAYAGGECSTSPPPSSLPIPGFLGKSASRRPV